MYRLSYGRTFNLGNYESEHIALEQDFDDSIMKSAAALKLQAEVDATHEITLKKVQEKRAAMKVQR